MDPMELRFPPGISDDKSLMEPWRCLALPWEERQERLLW